MADIKTPHESVSFRQQITNLWTKIIEVKAKNNEERRLGRLFNTLMVISTGIVIYLATIFLLMGPLGFPTPKWITWLAAAFPGAFIPLSIFCLVMAKRGHIQSMVILYSWINFIGISLAAFVFDGIYSPAWILFMWTITIAGTLIVPAYALWMTGSVIIYFIALLILTKMGIYIPPLSFGHEGREYINLAFLLVMMGSSVGLLTYLNIKTLREALGALSESENKYRKIFENVQDIFYQTDIAGNIIEISPSIERYSGFKREELIGTPVVNVYKNPNDRQGLIKAITERGEVLDYEIELKSKSGEVVYTSVNAHLLLDPSNKPIGIEGSLRDITERKKTEEELWNLSHKNELILASLGEGVYGVNLKGEATFINPAMLEMLGYSLTELLGKQLHSIIHHSRADGMAYPVDQCKIYAAYRDGATSRVNDEVFWRKDGTSFMVEYISAPTIENNKVVGAVVVFRDITERKHYEEQLKEANASKDKFFSIVAHDLKNPFNALLGASDALNEGIDDFDAEEIKDLSNMVNKSAKNAYALLENLLEWSRSQLGRIKFEPVDLNLRDIVHESLMAVESQAHNKKIKLVNNTGSVYVYADPNLLKTIIRNLLSNAIKYTNNSGTVTIGSKQMDGYMEISVTDTGVGIPSETIEKLFRIDAKSSTPGTAKETGTGLGLILCREFIEKHGGKIWVESEVGKGTIFTFTLPIKGFNYQV